MRTNSTWEAFQALRVEIADSDRSTMATLGELGQHRILNEFKRSELMLALNRLPFFEIGVLWDVFNNSSWKRTRYEGFDL